MSEPYSVIAGFGDWPGWSMVGGPHPIRCASREGAELEAELLNAAHARGVSDTIAKLRTMQARHKEEGDSATDRADKFAADGRAEYAKSMALAATIQYASALAISSAIEELEASK